MYNVAESSRLVFWCRLYHICQLVLVRLENVTQICFSHSRIRVSAESVTPLTCPGTKKTSNPTKNIKQTNKKEVVP